MRCFVAVELDPTNALAHYNLGASYERLHMIKEAVDEYVVSFKLDSRLRFLAFNPNLVNNKLYNTAIFKLYMEEGGSVTLPLQYADESVE